MKTGLFSAAALLLAHANAFPFLLEDNNLIPWGAVARSVEAEAKPFVDASTDFNAEEQYRSNQGKHKFVAPGPGDLRGPCPGLNVMSNHGYLPHNGRGTIEQFSEACQYVYGMSAPLAIFLSTFGAVLDGNLLSWSVGGKPHTGIGGAHSNYESDASIMRGDLHQYGNSNNLQMYQFHQLYNLQPDAKTADYDIEVMKTYRKTRFNQAVAENPVFFYEPFSGIEVTQAGFSFPVRYFSNKSAEYPHGKLDKNVLKSFFSIYGPEDKLYWKPGYEKIPDNWYTRAKNNPYGALGLQLDILYMATETPEIVTTGCNVAGKNTYDVIDPGDISGGAYTQSDVAKNPLCFSMAYIKARALSELGLAGDILGKVTSAVDGAMDEIGGCSDIADLDLTQLKGCPGFSLFGGPTGYVAKGAVQHHG